MRSYESIRDDLETGDLVLFGGSSLPCRIVQWATGSRWSHLGLVIRSDDIGAVLLWESSPFVKSPEGSPGVQLTPLSDRVAASEGPVSVRRLVDPLTLDEKTALTNVRRELRGRPYEGRVWQLLAAAYDGPGGFAGEDLSTLFCSEIVAEALTRIGRLEMPEGWPSGEWTPADFEFGGAVDNFAAALYGPEIPIK